MSLVDVQVHSGEKIYIYKLMKINRILLIFITTEIKLWLNHTQVTVKL